MCIYSKFTAVLQVNIFLYKYSSNILYYLLLCNFRYLRNPSELKIMKNLHMLREQRAAAAGHSSSSHPAEPRDLSVHPAGAVSPRHPGGPMQLSLSLEAEQLISHPQDLSLAPPPPPPLVKTEQCDRS